MLSGSKYVTVISYVLVHVQYHTYRQVSYINHITIDARYYLSHYYITPEKTYLCIVP